MFHYDIVTKTTIVEFYLFENRDFWQQNHPHKNLLTGITKTQRNDQDELSKEQDINFDHTTFKILYIYTNHLKQRPINCPLYLEYGMSAISLSI